MDFEWLETSEGWQRTGDGDECQYFDGDSFLQASGTNNDEPWTAAFNAWAHRPHPAYRLFLAVSPENRASVYIVRAAQTRR